MSSRLPMWRMFKITPEKAAKLEAWFFKKMTEPTLEPELMHEILEKFDKNESAYLAYRFAQIYTLAIVHDGLLWQLNNEVSFRITLAQNLSKETLEEIFAEEFKNADKRFNEQNNGAEVS